MVAGRFHPWPGCSPASAATRSPCPWSFCHPSGNTTSNRDRRRLHQWSWLATHAACSNPENGGGPRTDPCTAFTKPSNPFLCQALSTPCRPFRPTARVHRPPALGDTRRTCCFASRARKVPTAYLTTRQSRCSAHARSSRRRRPRGNITIHRARVHDRPLISTPQGTDDAVVAAGLAGPHRSPQSTQFDAEYQCPSTLTRAYDDACYFALNVRTIEVLVDRGRGPSGTAAAGEPGKHTNLGPRATALHLLEQCPITAWPAPYATSTPEGTPSRPASLRPCEPAKIVCECR